ncbi:MAG: phospholipid carrier-dependent glycosyltransferase [Spirochaetes bacterium]|nr:phospholipid carrier-dependent glycosyltransferase [Spirochaetota bacterium]
MKYAIRLSLFAIAIFSIMSYWGIRAPDGEIVFRTTQALATRGTFEVSGMLTTWKGFGLPEGKDGKRYSLFGPGEAIAAVPLYKIAELINSTEWYFNAGSLVGISHYTDDDGLTHFINEEIPQDLEPQALRMIVSVFNILMASLCVFMFFLTIKALTGSDHAALFTGILFAFGSLIFPYSGTFFSELLAIFFVMLSFYMLLYNKVINTTHSRLCLLLSGFSLGLAAATHITAILFAPFFCIYGAFPDRNDAQSSGEGQRPNQPRVKTSYYQSIRHYLREITPENIKAILINGLIFTAGFMPILSLIGYFNFIRFDSVLETGHTLNVTSQFGYGVFVAPWRGLRGLLISPGKGLLFFCPAIILGLIAWRPFHIKHRLLSFTMLAAALTRLIFIATRSDWHGGFGVGPRLLIVLIPFLMLPIGEWVGKMINVKNVKAIFYFTLISLICIAQQIYFSLGEIFSYFHIIKWYGINHGVNVFEGNRLYMSWDFSPLLYLLNGRRGPLLLNTIDINNYALWLLLIGGTALLLLLLYLSVRKNIPSKVVEK